MKCREDCGACCIAPSLSTPVPGGHPDGKPAGAPCVHLSAAMRCALFGDKRRPAACAAFMPEAQYCGDDREQALLRLTHLEIHSAPQSIACRSIP